MPVKPATKEEEYFARLELERKKKAAQEEAARLAEAEKQKLKELHWMRCPKDGSELVETEFRGVKVDVCPTCGGMWLDAGELDDLAQTESGGFLGGLSKFFKG